jgi:hypothetical protein
MSARLVSATALILAAFALPALAQTQAIPVELPTVYAPPEAAQAANTLSPDQLDQLVAPIALYPDPVLTDILAASTYPAQIAEAQRFAAAHQGLQGAALDKAAASHQWDPSIQALLNFPQVLGQLDSNLEWTDRLGQAFVAQQADVLNAIQRLRQRAEAAGTLTTTPQDDVVNEGGDIAILPPSDQHVFLPTYNTACVYGPDAGCGDDSVAWGDGLWLPYGFVPWGFLDWGHGRIEYNGYGHHGFGHGAYAGRDSDAGLHGGFGGEWHHAGGIHLASGGDPAEIGGLTHFPANPGQIGGFHHFAADGAEIGRLSHFPTDPAQLGSVTRGPTALDHFNYAPPAGQRFNQGGYGTRPIMPRPIVTAGFDNRGGAVHAAIGHAAPVAVAHGGGFGGGRR